MKRRRYLDSYGAHHGGTAGPVGFRRQPRSDFENGVAYCPCCGWVFAVQCSVPGCDRTRGNRKNDPLRRGMKWVCADHWRQVSARHRAVYNRARRRCSVEKTALSETAFNRIFERCFREAVERSVGL